MRIEELTTHIGAELVGVDLAEAIRNDDLFGTIKDALLTHKVLFLRDQLISKAEHVAFASKFGELEDHPVAGSDPGHPGLVCIYKDLDSPPDHYENSWHCDAPGAKSRRWARSAASNARRWEATRSGRTWPAPTKTLRTTSRHIDGLYARHSIEASSARACRSRSGMP